jgi:hypothetical protein
MFPGETLLQRRKTNRLEEEAFDSTADSKSATGCSLGSLPGLDPVFVFSELAE